MRTIEIRVHHADPTMPTARIDWPWSNSSDLAGIVPTLELHGLRVTTDVPARDVRYSGFTGRLTASSSGFYFDVEASNCAARLAPSNTAQAEPES
jgi:hypothetical protein